MAQATKKKQSVPSGSGVLSFAQLEALWIRAGGSPRLAPTMAAIALAESSGRYGPQSINNNPSTGDYSVGPWQINYFGSLLPGRTKQFGSPQTVANNPLANARAAVALAGPNGEGLDRNWTTYHNGAYRNYLPGAFVSAASDQGTMQNISFWNKTLPNILIGPPAGSFGGALGKSLNPLGNVPQQLGNALLPDWFSFSNLKRGAIIVGGFVLVIVGIYILTRKATSSSPVQVVSGAAGAAAQDARAVGWTAGRVARGRATGPSKGARSSGRRVRGLRTSPGTEKFSLDQKPEPRVSSGSGPGELPEGY